MHSLEFDDGHLFVHLPEGRALLDTGAPLSFGDPGAVSLAGTSIPIPRSAMGADLGHVRNLVRGSVVALLGMDVLGRRPFALDLVAGRFLLGEHALAAVDADRMARLRTCASDMHAPVLGGAVHGRPARLLFDTGAKCSYAVDPGHLAAAPDAGVVQDYNPIVGAFESPTSMVDVRLHSDAGDVAFPDRMGIIPSRFVPELRARGIAAVLGNGWLAGRRFALDVGRGEAWVGGA